MLDLSERYLRGKLHAKRFRCHPLLQANPRNTCSQPPFLKRHLYSKVPCVPQVKNTERFAASQLGSDPFAPWLALGTMPLAFGVRPQLFAATQRQNPLGKKRRRHSYPSRGFTFVMVLAAMLILALLSQGVMTALSSQAERERITEQQRIQSIYAKAIKAYYNASPGTRKQNPETLEDLLLDKRQVTIQRHLRRLYADPMQPNVAASAAWEVERDGNGRIQAVYSRLKNQAPSQSLGITSP